MEKSKRIICCADIHGAYKALKQCIERSNFDFEKDTLIQLGDVADGWSEVYECVQELLKVKNLISIKGNHDEWFTTWLNKGIHPVHWLQGGEGTLKSYCSQVKLQYFPESGGYRSLLTYLDIPENHRKFWNHQSLYYIDDQNRCFVHGGFNRHIEFKGQDPFVYYWDRDLWYSALSHKNVNSKFKLFNKFEEVYIGHTSTINWNTNEPMKASNIWNLDTGAGFNGKLTFMDVNTKEIWQSDNVKELYPNEKGR